VRKVRPGFSARSGPNAETKVTLPPAAPPPTGLAASRGSRPLIATMPTCRDGPHLSKTTGSLRNGSPGALLTAPASCVVVDPQQQRSMPAARQRGNTTPPCPLGHLAGTDNLPEPTQSALNTTPMRVSLDQTRRQSLMIRSLSNIILNVAGMCSFVDNSIPAPSSEILNTRQRRLPPSPKM
jgi:hypothetical protein